MYIFFLNYHSLVYQSVMSSLVPGQMVIVLRDRKALPFASTEKVPKGQTTAILHSSPNVTPKLQVSRLLTTYPYQKGG